MSMLQPPAMRPLAAEERQQAAELRVLASSLIERLTFARQHGLTFSGSRDLYAVLGYDRVLTGFDYAERYARGGIAGRIIDVYPNATWRGTVTLSEDEDPHETTVFEKAWKKLDQRLQIQAKLLRVDKLSLLNTYAVLLIGAGGDLDQELPRGKPDGSGIGFLTAYSGGGGPSSRAGTPFSGRSMYDGSDVTIYELDTDPKSVRFGLPISYWLKRSDIASDATNRPVHWTRIIHVADNCVFDDIYGQPGLERVWNLLDDLEKVTGGGAEAFWLRANAGLHMDIDKQMSLPAAKDMVEALKKQAEEYKHQLTRWLRTRGVNVTQLGSDVANFLSPADAVLTQIAGAKGIPKRILTGSEMGELASSQDRDNWKDQVNGRQTQHAGPYIMRPLVDRLIKYGHLPTPSGGPDEYRVLWPNIQVLTEDEKAAGALSWANTNKTMGETVFPNDEIRKHWYGFEPLSDKEKQPVAAPTKVSVQGDSSDLPDTEAATAAAKAGKPGVAAKSAKPPVADTAKPPIAKSAKPVPEPKAAQSVDDDAGADADYDEEAELQESLRQALESGNSAVVDEIIGNWKARAEAEWDEAKHPRGRGGKFTDGPAADFPPSKTADTRTGPPPGKGRAKLKHQFLSTPSDALASIANGEHATVAPEDARGVVLRAANEPLPIDLTNLTIEGRAIFAGGLNRPRDTMPQISREHQGEFLGELTAQGIRISHELVAPASLLPTQNEISANRVGQMLKKWDSGKKEGTLRPSLVSSDNYVLDGHHRWGMMAILDVENPGAHYRTPIIRIGQDRDRALAAMEDYNKRHNIKAEALEETLRTNAEWDEAKHPRDKQGEFTESGGGGGGSASSRSKEEDRAAFRQSFKDAVTNVLAKAKGSMQDDQILFAARKELKQQGVKTPRGPAGSPLDHGVTNSNALSELVESGHATVDHEGINGAPRYTRTNQIAPKVEISKSAQRKAINDIEKASTPMYPGARITDDAIRKFNEGESDAAKEHFDAVRARLKEKGFIEERRYGRSEISPDFGVDLTHPNGTQFELKRHYLGVIPGDRAKGYRGQHRVMLRRAKGPSV